MKKLYENMTPEEEKRFDAAMKEWASLTPEEQEKCNEAMKERSRPMMEKLEKLNNSLTPDSLVPFMGWKVTEQEAAKLFGITVDDFRKIATSWANNLPDNERIDFLASQDPAHHAFSCASPKWHVGWLVVLGSDSNIFLDVMMLRERQPELTKDCVPIHELEDYLKGLMEHWENAPTEETMYGSHIDDGEQYED